MILWPKKELLGGLMGGRIILEICFITLLRSLLLKLLLLSRSLKGLLRIVGNTKSKLNPKRPKEKDLKEIKQIWE
jgi:hypothetical protein